MIFPDKKYNDFSLFYRKYIELLSIYADGLNIKQLVAIVSLIEKKIKSGKNVFVCGNGGSAAIANHYVCDYSKLLRTDTNLRPIFYSFSSNIEMISAIANDISYEDIFSYQAKVYCKKGDLIIILSSSGSSKNIRKVVDYCNKYKIETVGISGFGGGYLYKNAKNSIKIDINNYGVVEDITQIMMHTILQFLKVKYLKKNNIKDAVF
jgi:phosphoheptose isomerase